MIESALLRPFRWQKFKKIWFLFSICLAVLNITACDYINNKLYPDFKANEIKTVVEKPPFARKNAKPNISIEKIRDVATLKTQDEDHFTVNPIALKNESPNPQALKENNLFEAPVQTDEERFTRLETHVQKISNMLDKMSPSITKLIGIESELDSLTYQLENLINKGKLDSLVTEEEETKQDAPPKTVATKKKKRHYKKIKPGQLIHTMRIGDHPDKTRIVFETTQKLDYEITIDNDENIMTISFPKGNLGSNPNIISHFAKLIKSISQNKEGEGSLIAFELTHKTQKLKEMRIPPGAKISRHRIVIDLKR